MSLQKIQAESDLGKAEFELVTPVWANAYFVRNALGQYEGLGKYATELNKVHGHFWGLAQKFALDAVVIYLCKLYDDTNKRYSKHTIPELCSYLEKNLSSSNAFNIQKQHLCELIIPEEIATHIISKFKHENKFEEAKKELIQAIKDVFPKKDQGTPLKKIFTVRHKFLAHQEQLSDILKEQAKSLPSLLEMEKLNEWAFNFCRLFVCIFVPSTRLDDGGPSAHTATLSVVKIVLKKDFQNWQDEDDFYKRAE